MGQSGPSCWETSRCSRGVFLLGRELQGVEVDGSLASPLPVPGAQALSSLGMLPAQPPQGSSGGQRGLVPKPRSIFALSLCVCVGGVLFRPFFCGITAGHVCEAHVHVKAPGAGDSAGVTRLVPGGGGLTLLSPPGEVCPGPSPLPRDCAPSDDLPDSALRGGCRRWAAQKARMAPGAPERGV